MITLHGASASPFVRKVLAVLAIKNLPFEHIQRMPFGKEDAEYQKISPLGKIPALQHGDFTLSDSTVICEYLEDVYPDTPIYPTDHQDRARARWYEELGGNRVTELAAGIFFQRFLRPLAFKQDPDEELVEKIINKDLPPILDYIESQVPAAGFLFGEQFMLADLSLISAFINASYAGYEVDAQRWPLTSGFISRVKSDPVVAPLLEAEAAMLGLS
ncbi:MAG TPA: glutathione S-transferase family protein [Porticoccus sp.]|nr:glutathione S-transferase family protein [Porticoccus sp.]